MHEYNIKYRIPIVNALGIELVIIWFLVVNNTALVAPDRRFIVVLPVFLLFIIVNKLPFFIKNKKIVLGSSALKINDDEKIIFYNTITGLQLNELRGNRVALLPVIS
ncbi:MAG: hypothetical protein FWE37_03425 [Spirochaetaceae bacterium]|nr:hypothetical protein [Spirochaetaceae bacterium]